MGKVENPVELIVAGFREEDKAAEVLAGLKDIAELMGPGSSAIIAVIEHKWVGQLVDALERRGGDHPAGVEG